MTLRRFFLLLIAAACAWLFYDIYRLHSVQRTLKSADDAYALAPPQADLEVTEFLDYSCTYCRQIHAAIMEAVRRDGRVRYIPRPLPSQNADSFMAAQAVYAAARQGRFIEMHNAVMERYRAINDAALEELAAEAGVDPARLKTDMESEDVSALLMENGRLFTRLKGKATPTFVIGPDRIFVPEGRMPDMQDFLTMFADERNSQ